MIVIKISEKNVAGKFPFFQNELKDDNPQFIDFSEWIKRQTLINYNIFIPIYNSDKRDLYCLIKEFLSLFHHKKKFISSAKFPALNYSVK